MDRAVGSEFVNRSEGIMTPLEGTPISACPQILLKEVVDATILITTSSKIHPKYVQRRERTLSRLQGEGISEVDIIDDEPLAADLERIGIDLWDDREGYFVGEPGKRVHESICYKHILALKQIVDRRLNSALICECDLLLHDKFSELFPEFWHEVPSDFDVVYVGFGYPIRQFVSTMEKKSSRIWSGAFWCNHCLIMRHSGAEKILAALPLHDQIDYFYGRLASEAKINSYAFYYEHSELEASGRCSYIPWGLAYQEKD